MLDNKLTTGMTPNDTFFSGLGARDKRIWCKRKEWTIYGFLWKENLEKAQERKGGAFGLILK